MHAITRAKKGQVTTNKKCNSHGALVSILVTVNLDDMANERNSLKTKKKKKLQQTTQLRDFLRLYHSRSEKIHTCSETCN